jgi:hypothetical protein
MFFSSWDPLRHHITSLSNTLFPLCLSWPTYHKFSLVTLMMSRSSSRACVLQILILRDVLPFMIMEIWFSMFSIPCKIVDSLILYMNRTNLLLVHVRLTFGPSGYTSEQSMQPDIHYGFM